MQNSNTKQATIKPVKPNHNISWNAELRATWKLAWPLIVAQVATMAIATTDVIMMGWLGPEYLAAGSLATSILYPFMLFGFGILGAVSPLVAQAIGAKQFRSVRRVTRQGLWLSVLLSIAIIPFLLQMEGILLFLRQEELTAELADQYMQVAAWHILPAFIFVVLRSLVSAHGNTSIILIITLVAIVINGILNYALIFGNFGMPRLELRGAGISTVIVNICMAFFALLYVLKHKRHKRYAILVRFWKPDWESFFKILRIGAPVGSMISAETGLFSAAAAMMGWLGSEQLAGHAVALQIAAISFMVPLGLSFATTIRVGLAYGRGNFVDVATAGWVSIALSICFMTCSCAVYFLFPELLVHLFLDGSVAKNVAPIGFAVSFLYVAAVFQLVDGAQVAAAAVLRGLNDTKIPMLIAIIGYWLIGLPTGYILGFVFDLGGVGIWFGLAAGLAFVAVVLITRFSMRDRLGLTEVMA